MRLNPKSHWQVRISELFEARFYRGWEHSPRLWDLIDGLNDSLESNPRACGEPHPGWKDGSVWVWEAPHLIGLPRIFVLYTFDAAQNVVTLWSLGIRPLR